MRIKAELLLLLIASFTVNLGYSAIAPMFPYLVLALKGLLKTLPEEVLGSIEAHRGAVEFGALMAAFMITRAPTAGLMGFLSDVFGRKKMMLIGMLLYFIVSIGFTFSNDIWTLTSFRALQGIASAMVWPVAEAYIADAMPRWERGRAISAYTASMLVAEILGPGIGVAIYKLYILFFNSTDLLVALKSPMIFLALLTLISLVTLIPLPSMGERGTIKLNELRREFKSVMKIIRGMPPTVSRSIKTIYLNGAINGLAIGIIHTVSIVYIIEVITKDPLFIGFFSMTFSTFALIATVFSGYLTDRMRRRKPIALLGYVLGRSSFLVMPFIREISLLLVVASLSSLVFGLSMPAMRALQADLVTSSVRGTVFGFQQLFFNSGIFAGSLLGGWLTSICAGTAIFIVGISVTGYIIPFWTAGILGLTTAGLFALYVEEAK